MAKKKISTGGKIAIGAGVALAGYLVWDNFIKKPKEPKVPEGYRTPQTRQTGVTYTDIVAQLPVGGSGGARGLSPLGTSPKNLNWDLKLTKGMEGGEVESLQRMLNRISKAYNKTGINVDGDFGRLTDARKKRIWGDSSITLTRLYGKVKRVEGDTGKPKEDNIDAAYAFIITNDPVTAATTATWEFFKNPFGLWG